MFGYENVPLPRLDPPPKRSDLVARWQEVWLAMPVFIVDRWNEDFQASVAKMLNDFTNIKPF